MIKITNLKLPFDHSDTAIRDAVLQRLKIQSGDLLSWEIKRRSLDARKNRPLQRVYSILVRLDDERKLKDSIEKDSELSFWESSNYALPELRSYKLAERPLVVGTGPAGLFAGLILAEAGLNPLLLERGKPVLKRTADVRNFWQAGDLQINSNVQFGEGGAGTFSDGKLGTRIKDKSGRREKILQELVAAGAPQDILYESKPHVGTANLVEVVQNLRKRIERLGGEYRFETRVDDLLIDGAKMVGVVLSSGEEIQSSSVVLAIGHSARDTFSMLAKRGVNLAPKPFSAGFRIEHHQEIIDRNQYGAHAGHPALEAAEYQLSYHTSLGRTVYSFCMCPGGTVIGAASESGEVVTNGMSQYERSGKNANSAIVAEVFPEDFGKDPLGGFELQRQWERKAYQLGGENYSAPVQLVGDFLARKPSRELGAIKPTYQPGIRLVDLRQTLPTYITEAISEALGIFEQKITGFTTVDAVLTGVETRTSCPLRILRGKDFQSVSIRGLYPAGEGSGYAGGIMSSAIDGMKAAEMVVKSFMVER